VIWADFWFKLMRNFCNVNNREALRKEMGLLALPPVLMPAAIPDPGPTSTVSEEMVARIDRCKIATNFYNSDNFCLVLNYTT
jgi:hypothetical protein